MLDLAKEKKAENNYYDGYPIRLSSIGGTGMFGMNCMFLETGDTKLLIDCGVMFPSDDDWGVDLITPDFTILETSPPHAIVLTHAHEDHIGAIPHFLKALLKHGYRAKMPIYGTDITLAFVKRRLTEHELLNNVKFYAVKAKDCFSINSCRIECVDMCHSIPGSLAYVFETVAGKIFHSGDWRIDHTPMAGAKTNLSRLESLGDEGVRLLLADSTNVEVESCMASEFDIFNDLQNTFSAAQGRVFVTLFASNIGRLQSIFLAAANAKRKVAICGRSLNTNLAIAQELNYLSVPPDLEFVREDQIEKSDDALVIVISGSQGEKSSSLYKLSQGKHNSITLRPSDTLIYSARQIPGNEKRVGAIIDGFYRHGASLVSSQNLCFHSSGHGGRKELELLIELLDPSLFIPIHGDLHRLSLHEALAGALPQSKTLTDSLPEGYSLYLSKDKHEVKKSFEPSRRYVVGKLYDGLDKDCAKEKKVLGHHGLLFIAGVLNTNDQLQGKLRIEAYAIARNDGYLDEIEAELQRTIASSAKHGDMQEIIRHKAARFIKSRLGKFPQIIVHFVYID